MLSEKRYQLARNVGNSVANGNFVFFLNPLHRGKNFKWDDLYHISDSFSRSQIGLCGDFKNDQKAMEKVAAESSKYTLDSCFKESGIKNWIKL